MKSLAGFLLLSLFAQTGESPRPPAPSSFRYSRSIAFPVMATNLHSPFACASLDADVFAHTNATMSDLRLFNGWEGSGETPYVITLSGATGTPEPAHILNLGSESGSRIAFDLKMPSRPYSALDLQLNAQDFIASATLQGLRESPGLRGSQDKHSTYLGTFTLFDLSSQRLGRNLHLEFAESTFPYLHLELTLTPAPGSHAERAKAALVTGADVPASRLAQVSYTPVLASSGIDQQSRRSVATFKVPAHVPVERITFDLEPSDDTSFSRRVLVSATPAKPSPDTPLSPEELSGQITRVHVREAGQEVREQSLTVPAILGSNAQSAATVRVSVENGDDRPAPIKSVRLEMRERTLCFSRSPDPSGEPTQRLFYGGEAISAPVYDLGRLFDPAKPALQVTLGPEQQNRRCTAARPAPRPFTDRHPAILWATLLAVLAVLSSIAFRSAKRL